MRYLGGKTKISKYLAAEINKYRENLPFWDPFCGSLAMSLALGGRGVSSDSSLVLISLYRAVWDGWVPPDSLSKDDWAAAKTLPDTDPIKGFAGFPCSYRGMYFSGYGGGLTGGSINTNAAAASTVLKRDIGILKSRGVQIAHLDFFSIEPRSGFLLYLDPPYRGTTGYRGTKPFDHEAFYARAKAWSDYCPVLVSEYSLPIGKEIWSRTRKCLLTTGTGDVRTERLYLITP